MKRPWLSCILCIAATACIQPTTQPPKVNESELEQERRIHQEYAAAAEAEKQKERLETRLKMQARLTRVFLPVAMAGAQVCSSLNAYRAQGSSCVFDVKLVDLEEGKQVSGVNAAADGKHIYVTPAMMRFAKDDNELALVLAHELAHNILRHPESATTNVMAGSIIGTLIDAVAASQGVSTGGAFSDIGAGAGRMAYSVGFESEADYVGMYILARTKYDYASAPHFWRRMSAREPDGIVGGSALALNATHPSNPERYVAMQKTAEEIRRKKVKGQPLLPEFEEKQGGGPL